MRITQKLCMDLARAGCKPIVAAVQGEGNTRVLEIDLFDKGIAWEIPAGTTAAVAFQKPDGTKGLYDKLPNGDPATTISGSTVTAILAPQALTCAGTVLASVVFYDADMDTLATFPFKITVEANPAAGEQISNDYYALQTLGQVNAAYAELLRRVAALEAGEGGGTVKTVNGIAPDEDGNVDTTAPTDAQVSSAVSKWLEEHPEATTTVQDGSVTVEKLSDDVKEAIEKASKSGGGSAEYKWVPRGLMREQKKIFQGWTHCVRYDERLGKAVGIVMAGEAAHTNEQPWYRVTIDDNGYMSDYEEITIFNTDGSTTYTPNNGYVCGFCILADGTYLIQDNDFTTDSTPNFYKSTDYGKTFTKVNTVGIPSQAFGLRQLSTGRIISGSAGARNRFYYSDDGGINWSESNVLDSSVLGKPPFEADSKYEFAEHCIVEFSNGKLLAIGRTSNNARDAAGAVRGHLEGAAVAYSDDYGATWRDFGWSKTITNMTSNNAACVCINGIYHLVMGDRYTYTKDKEGNRRYFAMYYQWATEEDALNDNWSEPVVIDYGHWTSAATTPTDSGYPSLWKDAADNLHCVFYDGDGSGHAYGANWWLIDGNPCVQSKSVSDEGSGSLAVSYSQKQVDTMLSAQKQSLMAHINKLYMLVGELPDVEDLDGSMYVTDGLVDYFEPENTEMWSSDNKEVVSSLGTGNTICTLLERWDLQYCNSKALSTVTNGMADVGGFYTKNGLSGYDITDGFTVEYYGKSGSFGHTFAPSFSAVANKMAAAAAAETTMYKSNGGDGHCVITVTNDTVKTYNNGVLKATEENTSDVATLVAGIYLARLKENGLAQVRIYNRVLTDEEVANNSKYTSNYVASLAAGE